MCRRQLTSINGKWIIQSEEEVRALQKKMQQLENDLDQAQENLLAANSKLEEKDKALQTVSSSIKYLSVSQTEISPTRKRRRGEKQKGHLNENSNENKGKATGIFHFVPFVTDTPPRILEETEGKERH